jgi:FKBP-type peptidyl-prolyl cis-trans isomerase FkpA
MARRFRTWMFPLLALTAACMPPAKPPANVQAQMDKDRPFLEGAAKETGAVALPSGVIYRPVVAGTGRKIRASDTVKVSYTGRLSDGHVFDASDRNGGPMTSPLSGLISCWRQGAVQMNVGGKAVLTCPSESAYGDGGVPGAGIPGGAVLQFDIEVLSVEVPR